MGRTARMAYAKVRESAQLGIVQQERARHGQQKGTDRVVELVIVGLAKLTDEHLLANLRRRSELLAECQGDVEAQKRELERAGKAFLYWLEYYGWTYDPRHRKMRTLPFVPFDFQRDAAAWLEMLNEQGIEGIIEKARDMGATWLVVAWFVWSWLFEDQFTGLFCSRKVTLVDSKGDPSSIMEKARIMIRNLPSWMVPVGYEESKHALKLRILNPVNGSLLVGEGGNQIGRGGRASRAAIDEAAFITNPGGIEAALGETCEVKLWLSTPNNPGDWFSQKRFSGNYPVLSLRWMQDPRKNTWLALDAEGTVLQEGKGEAPDPKSIGARRILYPWYEGAKARYTDRARMAREVDIDYSASSDRLVFPAAWVRAAVGLDLGDMGTIVECGADLAGEGIDEDIWTMRRGAVVVIQRQVDRETATGKARVFLGATASVKARVLHADAGGGYAGALKGTYDEDANDAKQTGGQRKYPFMLHMVNLGGKCSMRRFGDRPARELFKNMRAELHWTVRERFRKAYELWLWRQGDENGVPHDPDECISIPNDEKLISQLCSILFVEVSSGKVQLESKDDMKARGVKSPDRAESMILTFAPTPNPAATDPAGTSSMAS